MARRNLATFSEAQELIRGILSDGEWHKSRDIHAALEDQLSDPMFGRVKKKLGIEHRQVGGGPGSYFEWHLPRRPG